MKSTYMLVVIDYHTREVLFYHNLLTIFEMQKYITKYQKQEHDASQSLYTMKCYLETEDCHE